MTVAEVAALIRSTPESTYAKIERGQIPGVVRIGRNVRVRRADLLKFLGLT